jgi:tryptophan-rich sensory protein
VNSRSALLLFICVCQAVGAFGAFWTQPEIPGWYAGIAKPSWTPPNAWFGPVWSALYILMSVAAWRVWKAGGRRELTVFWAQLSVNGAWSWLFFGLNNPLFGLIDLSLLVPLVWATASVFARKDRIAAALFVPYGLWVSFAWALNLAIWRLNP